MPSKDRYGRIKKKIEKLRDHSLTVASKANRILADGVQRLADRELRSLNEAYRTTLTALKRGSSTRDDLVNRAHQQLDVMQRAADQLIASARHAVEVASKARADLTALVGRALQGEKVSRRDIERAVKPARDLLARTRKTPVAKKKKAASGGRGRAAARPKAKTVAAAAKKPGKTRAPSANSRAGRATSGAKKESPQNLPPAAEPMGGASPHPE
jgi:phasin family protein